jgi:Flp pilus assembly protein TadG
MSRRGGAAIEFALILPILVLLLTGGTDIVLWLRAWFRVERTASEVANVASQYQALTTADINALFAAGQVVAGGVDVTKTAGGQVISLVTNDNGGAGGTARNLIVWQRRIGAVTSKIGTQGSVATLPAAFTVPLGQTVLVTEAFNTRNSWVYSAATLGSGGVSQIYSYTVVRPRSAQLSTPPA